VLACQSEKPPAAAPPPPKPAKAETAVAPTTGPKVSPAAVLDRVKPLFSPLPAVAENPDNPITEEKVALGRTLYYDARLSKNHDLSCNSCHDLAQFGVDVREKDGKRLATSLGHRDQVGDRNSPTVYNAGFHVAQFWDGRAGTLEDQAKGPVLNPVEMAMPSEAAVVAVLESIPGYVEAFKAAFPGEAAPVTFDNMAKAIGAFERKLQTPSRVDEFLGGKMTALSKEELHGFELFLDVGCVTCHNGSAFGGTQFQKLGSVKTWPGLKEEGRFKVTQAAADKHVFKVSSLRNITKTGPYLHDGSIDDLGKVVAMMAEHQTARGTISQSEVASIVAFLGALEGAVPAEYIAKPEMPASGPSTPAPDPS